MQPSPHMRLEFLSSDYGILFDERTQMMYGLQPHLAYLWHCIEQGATRTDLMRELTSRSELSLDAAEQFIESAVKDWSKKGFFDPSGLANLPGDPLNDLPRGRQFKPMSSRFGCIGGTVFVINYESTYVEQAVQGVFRHVETEAQPVRFAVWVSDACNGRFEVGIEDRCYDVCPDPRGLVPTVKGAVAFGTLLKSDFSLGIHAAAVARRGQAILLPGRSGAGKTTFTLGLAKNGFSYLCDDTVFLDSSRNEVQGLTFPAAVKSPAWPVIGSLYPQLFDRPIHRRADDKLVRYLHPQGSSSAFKERYPVAKIIVPKWQEDSETKLCRLDKLIVLRALVTEGYSRFRRLTGDEFSAVVRWLFKIDCYELVYSDMEEAVSAVKALCD